MPATSSTLNDSAVRRVTRSEELIAFIMSPGSAIRVLMPASSLGCERMRGQVVEHGEHAVDRVGDVAGAVQGADLLGEPASPGRPGGRSGLRDLVADRVEDDAGVVDVLGDHRLDVALPPLREVQAVVEVALGRGPHVERLVHDQHAEAVAGVKHRLAHRVVGHPDRVEAGVLEYLDAAFLGAGEGRRAEDPVVVVDAGAAQLHGLAVDPQARARGRAAASGCRR